MSFYSQVNRSHFVLFSESFFIYYYFFQFFFFFLVPEKIFCFVNLKMGRKYSRKTMWTALAFWGFLRIAFLLKPISRGKVKHSHFQKKKKNNPHTQRVLRTCSLKKISFKNWLSVFMIDNDHFWCWVDCCIGNELKQYGRFKRKKKKNLLCTFSFLYGPADSSSFDVVLFIPSR